MNSKPEINQTGTIPVLQVEQVAKTYHVGTTDLMVLKGVTLTVSDGERVAIMGPSGAGKSTLLHVMGGLDRPSKGRLLFKGDDYYALPIQIRTTIRARHIGFVFQSYHLLPELDVLENVMLPTMALSGARASRTADRARARDLLAAVGLSERLNHTPLELSGGEQQRVAIARALMNKPEVLLADEPTGNLDTATGEQVLHHLFELTRQINHTLVLVTHNAEVAKRCDRTVTIVDGRIQ